MAVILYEPKLHPKSTAFEEALAQTKFGRFNYFVITLSGIIIVNSVLEAIGISYILPIAESDLNYSQKQKSILSGINFIGIIVSSHLWGFLADTLGRKKIMIPSLSIAFCLTVLSSFSVNFLMLVLLRFLNGIFTCGGSSTVFAYLSEFHIRKKRNKAIMAASFLSAIVAVSFPFVAWLIINQDWKLSIVFLGITYKPWRLYLLSCGFYGMLGVLGLSKCYESPKFLLCIGKDEKSLQILKNMYSINTGNDPDKFTIDLLELEATNVPKKANINQESSKSVLSIFKLMWMQTKPLFSSKLIRGTGLLCLMQFFTFLSAHGMRMWMPEILNSVQIYLGRENVTTDTTVCYIVEHERMIIESQKSNSEGLERIDKLEFGTIKYSIIFESAYPIAFLLVASGMKIIGRIKIIFLILTICGTCGVASTLIKSPVVGIFLYLIQLLVGIGVTVINSLSVELFPTHLKSMAVSLALMFGRIGSVFGSNISGMLMPNHCQSTFVGSGLLLILTALLGFFLPKLDKTVLPTETNSECENDEQEDDEIYITKL